ncbi:MAG: PAS domain-containing sensor histidine kinase [Sulfurimonas sp.]|nr:PAS domain-containing sensor histidine kinase [Sulfurimonas sp.]
MAQETAKHNFEISDITQKIIANIDSGVLVLDDELNIHSFNKWLELHTSLKEEKVLNKKINDLFNNINVKILTRKIKTALKIQTPTYYTSNTSKYLIPIQNNQIGTSKYSFMQQDVSIIPLCDVKKLVALIITNKTNMANTHALLKENIVVVEKLHNEVIKEREIIDRRVLLVKINKELIITDASKAYLKLSNYTKDQLLGKSFFSFKKYNFSKKLKEEIIHHIKTQSLFKFEYKTIIKNAEELWFKVTLVPEYDINDKHIGFLLFKNNITASKELQTHQEQVILNSRFTAMEEMINMIAHQWRQPLSQMSSIFINIKLKKDLGTLDAQYLDNAHNDIYNTIQYLSTLIDDFRGYFNEDEYITEVAFHNIFEKSKIFIQSNQKIDKITYIQNIDKDLKISTYKNKLIHVIVNIFKNSIDAFKDKKIKNKKITINATKENNYILIHIIDNAGGIKKDIIKKVFEPYFSTKSKNRTGLGLYMSKKIVQENLNGTISVTSNNENTDLLIKLPLQL